MKTVGKKQGAKKKKQKGGGIKRKKIKVKKATLVMKLQYLIPYSAVGFKRKKERKESLPRHLIHFTLSDNVCIAA